MYSKGITWINDCRIPFVDEKDSDKTCKSDLELGESKALWLFTEKKHKRTGGNTQGRFPANILVSDDMLNDGVITKQSQRTYKPTDTNASFFGNLAQAHGVGIGDSGSSSRYYDIDKWFNNLIDD